MFAAASLSDQVRAERLQRRPNQRFASTINCILCLINLRFPFCCDVITYTDVRDLSRRFPAYTQSVIRLQYAPPKVINELHPDTWVQSETYGNICVLQGHQGNHQSKIMMTVRHSGAALCIVAVALLAGPFVQTADAQLTNTNFNGAQNLQNGQYLMEPRELRGFSLLR